MAKVIAPTALYKPAASAGAAASADSPAIPGPSAQEVLAIRWNDGTESRYGVRDLRCACPCAVCVNEWTGEKMLDDAKVPAGVKPARIFSVGRYAMGVHWSDGHKTGIYSYDYLKKIGPGRPA
jgi:DUF971 family protein